jgi:hypothetical protein
MKVRNTTRGKLLAGISAAQTSIVLDGTYAPDPNNPSVFGGDAFWTTSDVNSKPTTSMPILGRIAQYSDNSAPSEDTLVKSENVWITDISSDTLTVIRGGGRTNGTNFSAGDWLEINWSEEVAMAHLDILLNNDPYTTSFFNL